MKKIVKNNIFGFVLGAIIFSVVGVTAATLINGKEVTYDNKNSKLEATNTQDAIDEIYNLSKTHCPDGFNCTQNYKCSGDNCKKCIRATTLHTEICSNTDTSGYCLADGYSIDSQIIYGSFGTSGTLTSGDAFDCDVNGDGTYDATAERFYYVTDMNENISVLVYYNNVSEGVPSNSTIYAYNNNHSETEYYGPQTAIEQLPTTTQWKNVSLINSTRNITDATGNVRVSGFSYGDKAARLLTYQEVNEACYDGKTNIINIKGLSNKCKYLMENSKYSDSSFKAQGTWLETPDYSNSTQAYSIGARSRIVYYNTVNLVGNSGVRPAIEILKSDISY